MQPGDLLTIFNDSSRKEVIWSGEVRFVETKKPYPDPDVRQDGIALELWRDMFERKRPAELATDNPKKISF